MARSVGASRAQNRSTHTHSITRLRFGYFGFDVINKPMQLAEGAQTKLLEMYETRDAILSRINPDIVSVIDIDKFLQAAVTEVGQRLAVDRCNVITPSGDGGFRVSHEYLTDKSLTPGIGLNIPPSLVPSETIRNYL